MVCFFFFARFVLFAWFALFHLKFKFDSGIPGILIEAGKRHIGSAVDLNKRLKDFFSKSYLENHKTMYICNALRLHGYRMINFLIFYLENPPPFLGNPIQLDQKLK